MRYAARTEVSPDRSRAQIEQTLMRYGAGEFISGWSREKGYAALGFELEGKMFRMNVPMPDPAADEFVLTETGRDRSETQARQACEQATRQIWRAALLVIKAKLEAVEAGISTIEQEFMPHLVLPSGATLGETLLPQIDELVKSGKVPSLLPAPGKGS